MFVSDKRLYLTRDGRVTEDAGEASGGTLLVAVGGELSTEDAQRYGLIDSAKGAKGLANKGRKATENKAAPPAPEVPAEVPAEDAPAEEEAAPETPTTENEPAEQV